MLLFIIHYLPKHPITCFMLWSIKIMRCLSGPSRITEEYMHRATTWAGVNPLLFHRGALSHCPSLHNLRVLWKHLLTQDLLSLISPQPWEILLPHHTCWRAHTNINQISIQQLSGSAWRCSGGQVTSALAQPVTCGPARAYIWIKN